MGTPEGLCTACSATQTCRDHSLWRYQDPDGEHTLTESEIIEVYFPYWKEQMEKAGKADEISERGCIEDFVVVHWAWRIE